MSGEIFILPGNTDLNRGDQALVWETIEVVKEVCPDVKFVLFESGVSKKDAYLQSRQTQLLGHEIVPKILRHPSRLIKSKEHNSEYISHSIRTKLLWGLQAVLDFFSSSLLLSKIKIFNIVGEQLISHAQRESLRRLKNAQAVIVKGGGFIHAYGKATDFYTMYFSLFHVKLAQRLGKKVIIFPNSIGPVKGIFTRIFVGKVLRNTKLITVREQVSKDYLKSNMGLETLLFPDLGFFLKSKDVQNGSAYLKSKGIPVGEKKIVGITLRPYRFPKSENPKLSYQNYISEIVSFVKTICSQNVHVIFFAHTLGPSAHEDDRLALRDVIDTLDGTTQKNTTYIEDADHDCRDLQDMYTHLDVMVGTRFHSVIFALNSFVPCIAIAYGGNKSFGIMNDMGLNEYVFPIEKFTKDDLIISYNKILDNEHDYKEKIKVYKEYLAKQRVELCNKVSEFLK